MKVYLNTAKGGLWAKKPALAFLLSILIGCLFFFGAIIILAFLRASAAVMAVVLLAIFTAMVAVPIYMNETKNRSKNIGFVLDDNGLYIVKLDYLEMPQHRVINTPGAPILQAVLLPHNIKAAKQAQSAEKEIQSRRLEAQAYADAVIQMKADHSQLPPGVRDFGFMLRPKVEKANKRKLWISFDQAGNRVMRSYQNAYAELTEDLKSLEAAIGPTAPAVPIKKSAEGKKEQTRVLIFAAIGLVVACGLWLLGIPLWVASLAFTLVVLLSNTSKKK